MALGTGVDGTDVLDGVAGGWMADAEPPGMIGWSVTSETVVITEPASDAVDPRRAKPGRGPDGMEGVRE